MKKAAAEERKRDRVLLRGRTVRIKVQSKFIPTSFSKIEGRSMFVGPKEGRLIELVGDQYPSPETPPKSKIGRKRRNQKRCQERSDFQRSDGEE